MRIDESRRSLLRSLLAAAAFAALIVIAPSRSSAADEAAAKPKTGQHAYYFEGGEGIPSMGYWLYLPPEYGKDKDKRWPVMLFLHGSGERGDGKGEVAKVKIHGPPKVVEREKDFPFIVISPQCPTGRAWHAAALLKLLDQVTSTHQADADRVYLTGLSLGGFGTWTLAAQAPQRFAAIVPICGGGNPADAAKIKDIPTWVFHGEDDTAVKIARSEAMVEALKAAGAKDVQFTRYPKTGHDSWTKTYDDPKLYEWLLTKRRGAADEKRK